MNQAAVASPPLDVTEHPLVHDINQEHRDSLSATEKLCQRVATATGAPLALGLAAAHAELRAEHDHDSISRLLYHQEIQERLLLAIATRTDANVEEMKAMVAQLASEDSCP